MEIGNIKISRLKETNDDEAEAEAHSIANSARKLLSTRPTDLTTFRVNKKGVILTPHP